MRGFNSAGELSVLPGTRAHTPQILPTVYLSACLREPQHDALRSAEPRADAHRDRENVFQDSESNYMSLSRVNLTCFRSSGYKICLK